MAKTMLEIRMNYTNALKQAEKHKAAADSIQKDITASEQCRQTLASSWTGANAEAYNSKLAATEQKLAQLKKNLNDAAQTVKRIAERTYNTEMKTLEISRNRTYNG